MKDKEKEYVNPPKEVSRGTSNLKSAISNNGVHAWRILKNIYSYLHPSYRNRKLLQYIFVFPFVFLVYNASIFQYDDSFFKMLIVHILLVVAGFFYPFGVYWYKTSVFAQFFENLWFFGGYGAVIWKVLVTMFGQLVFAGVISPITGVWMWRKCVKKNIIIGEEKDFE